ncbi:hypothetical protein TELCIR_03151 [Teladorsagia circumcincta]|uniref:Uncharacterized protein n=1 Tax=Teladorsagia circumcincta TaxID=45464 RepID=A0A2G9UX35_TELCI|nr:hypothetical protein TELCIR_03151 [Teladorsagia circumcincta]
MLTPTFVESSERVKARKEKEEEEELARVLAWEQKQIRELQERRERMRRERKAEIERVMRERAEERKRMEAARAERRQRRMLEEQKKQQEERMEKERQAKLAAELEQQKQKEIERLRDEHRRQILKKEEERRKEQEERHRKVVEEERKNLKEEFQRREQEKAQREFKAQQEKQRSRRIEVDDPRGETDPRQAEEHFETDRLRKGDRLEVKRIEWQPTDSLSKRRRQELMARFGSQARYEGSNEKLGRSLEYESYETDDRQENDLNSSVNNEAQDTWKTKASQPSEPEPENTVEEEINDTVEPRKTLVRKTIQRRLRGIKTFSETKPGETLVKDIEEKTEAVNQAHLMNSTTTGISTGFTPTVYTVYNSPSGTDPVVVQPVLA